MLRRPARVVQVLQHGPGRFERAGDVREPPGERSFSAEAAAAFVRGRGRDEVDDDEAEQSEIVSVLYEKACVLHECTMYP